MISFMSLQYISDSNGIPTGVFIPLNEWENIKNKYDGLEEDLTNPNLPAWQKKELDKRIEDYNKSPNNVQDFDEAMNEIESELEL